MKMQKWLLTMATAAALGLGANYCVAQNNNPPGGGGGGGGGGRGNFDPAQMRERMMERYKEVLEVNNDDEWKALQPLVEKVTEARMQSMAGMGRGMFGGPRRGGNDDSAGQRRQGQAREAKDSPFSAARSAHRWQCSLSCQALVVRAVRKS